VKSSDQERDIRVAKGEFVKNSKPVLLFELGIPGVRTPRNNVRNASREAVGEKVVSVISGSGAEGKFLVEAQKSHAARNPLLWGDKAQDDKGEINSYRERGNLNRM